MSLQSYNLLFLETTQFNSYDAVKGKSSNYKFTECRYLQFKVQVNSKISTEYLVFAYFLDEGAFTPKPFQRNGSFGLLTTNYSVNYAST